MAFLKLCVMKTSVSTKQNIFSNLLHFLDIVKKWLYTLLKEDKIYTSVYRTRRWLPYTSSGMPTAWRHKDKHTYMYQDAHAWQNAVRQTRPCIIGLCVTPVHVIWCHGIPLCCCFLCVSLSDLRVHTMIDPEEGPTAVAFIYSRRNNYLNPWWIC